MFRVYVNRVAVHYEDCPPDGVEAVDWRRAKALVEAPTSFVKEIDLYSVQDEPLCRLAADKLDKDADLNIKDGAVRLSVAAANLLCGLPKDWQEEDQPLTPEERAALTELIEKYPFPTYPS